MAKARDLREETIDELNKRLQDLEEQLFKLRFQDSTGQIDDVHKISNVKKDRARVMTVLTEKRKQEEVDG